MMDNLRSVALLFFFSRMITHIARQSGNNDGDFDQDNINIEERASCKKEKHNMEMKHNAQILINVNKSYM